VSVLTPRLVSGKSFCLELEGEGRILLGRSPYGPVQSIKLTFREELPLVPLFGLTSACPSLRAGRSGNWISSLLKACRPVDSSRLVLMTMTSRENE
jgi:hypothetical protein